MSNRWKRALWALFLAVVLGLAAVIYWVPGLANWLKKTTLVEYGKIVQKTDTAAWLVKSETVLESSLSGSVQYEHEEGERIRKGSTLFQVFPGGSPVKASESALVSYYLDGLEGLLTPDTMETVARSACEGWTAEPVYSASNTASAGQKLMKLVDGDLWYVLFWVDKAESGAYKENDTVELTLPGGSLQASVYRVKDDGESGVRILLKTNRFYPGLGKERQVRLTAVTSDRTGLYIKNSAIAVENGREGVYVKQVSGAFTFVPIQVLSTDGTYSVVAEGSFSRTNAEGATVTQATINAYDEILNNPAQK